MKAFVSYSHKDAQMLERLHTHLSQLKRDGLLSSWTDEEINAGEKVNDAISRNLESSQIFLALLSPDYIASRYCYEKEFKKALELNGNGRLAIVPIILEPCDWLSTPFSDFKALPKDGKAVSVWQNINTAFLDIIQNIRKLLTQTEGVEQIPARVSNNVNNNSSLRNYRVKKDFDSIQKMEFAEQSFTDIRKMLIEYIDELLQIDEQIKCRIINNSVLGFDAILVNRNKIGSEATLKLVSSSGQDGNLSRSRDNSNNISYVIKAERKHIDKTFSISFDEFHLFWSESGYSGYYGQQQKELTPKEIVDVLWSGWLESVGIL